LMETVATLLALVIGILALVSYYSKKNNTTLFIGSGFLGTAFLDGYHAIVASDFFIPFMPSEDIAHFPWSWLASRTFLSINIYLSILVWKKGNKPDREITVSHNKLYIVSIVLTLSTFLLFSYISLTPGYFYGNIIHRPQEFIPAIFFALALIGYLEKGFWKEDGSECWFILALIVSLVCHVVYMPFSAQLFDIEFDVGHMLKIFSYILVLVGLFINIRNIHRQADQANRAKSDFLNIMSHELRTPLTVILGYTPLLSRPEKLPATKKLIEALDKKDIDTETISILLQNSLNDFSKYILKMDKSGKHLLSLINDMLDLSKIEANMMNIDPQPTSVDQITNSIKLQFEKTAQDKGILLNVISHGEYIYADERKVTQILINLVSNAFKFTENGSVSILTISSGGYVEFQVCDTGCGIEEADLSKIFNQFEQVDSTATRGIGGSGLGLTITKRLVELQGGKILVSSGVGIGTIFTFTLPIAREDYNNG